jgi:acyl-CoA reductase-like NAD-dependent aldehyde dehydrogenase
MIVAISPHENKEEHLNAGADTSEETGKRSLLRSVNPYDGQTLKTYPEMTPDEVDRGIAGAHERFRTWRRASIPERAALLLRAADLCLEREELLARLMTLEMGKRIAEACKEVRAKPASAFFEPTILVDVQKGTPAYDEELFGPVASVMIVPDEKTAIKVANDTKYGLGASVYTTDQARGCRVADQIDAGMVYINHPAWIYEDMPFGGIKKSGYGRECGPLGIEEFLNKKLYREM